MKIVHVIPIARGMSRELLTYWSPESVPLGSIVHVPLRNREVPGIVLKSEELSAVKAEVRQSAFQLKKLSNRQPLPFFSSALIEAVAHTAVHSAATMGAVLAGFIPAPLFAQAAEGSLVPAENGPSAPGTTAEILVFQADDAERVVRYKSYIREAFARGESVYLCVPTLLDAQLMEETLSKGIEEYTAVLHSGIGKKRLRENLHKIFHEPHPLLVVGTGGYLAAQRSDLKTIILERESARAYKLPSRPHFDLRYLIEQYAQARGIRLILGGLPLRIETLWRHEAHELGELTPPSFRLLSGAPSAIIDMRKPEGKATGSPFEVLSPELKAMLEHNLAQGEHALLFVSRRGLAPLTVCQDCGSVVRATDGDAPMVLHQSPSGNVFVSHRTGEVRSAQERCRVCQSWRLEALGIGAQRVAEEVALHFPTLPQFRTDQDAAATRKQVMQTVRDFYATAGSVLIATERAIGFLRPLEHGAIVSIDSLLSLPEWRASERTFQLLLRIRSLAQKSYLVQTRKTDQSLIEHALYGNIGQFYKEEIALRKALCYPPFCVLIKISLAASLERGAQELQKLCAHLEPFGIEPYPAPLQTGKHLYLFQGLIRVDRASWPDPTLMEHLAALPPYVAVDVNPEQLL